MNDADEIDRVATGADTDFDRLILLIAEGQRATVTTNVNNWYRSVTGHGKPYGVLAGVAKNRADWRYTPENDLLATLVQLAAVDIPKGGKEQPTPQPVGLGDFLYWLEYRYGILVARPPAEFASIEATAAAKRNLAAMTGRLRQMGMFRDLSDDFTVQRLTPPYMTNIVDCHHGGDAMTVIATAEKPHYPARRSRARILRRNGQRALHARGLPH